MANELAARAEEARGMIPLSDLQSQAVLYCEQIAIHYLQLGRVLISAKEQVPHGEWGAWLAKYAPVGERTAQKMMACYRRFGANAMYTGIDKSKLEALLALPDGTEDEFMAEHDVATMSARDVAKQAKEAKQPEAVDEKAMQEAIEKKAAELAKKMTEAAVREKTDAQTAAEGLSEDLTQARKDLEQLRNQYTETFNSVIGTPEEKQALRNMIKTAEEAADEAERKFFELQSSIARGDTGKEGKGGSALLSISALTDAVRTFLTGCGTLPHMGRLISQLPNDELECYRQQAALVADWVSATNKALETVTAEGSIVE